MREAWKIRIARRHDSRGGRGHRRRIYRKGEAFRSSALPASPRRVGGGQTFGRETNDSQGRPGRGHSPPSRRPDLRPEKQILQDQGNHPNSWHGNWDSLSTMRREGRRINMEDNSSRNKNTRPPLIQLRDLLAVGLRHRRLVTFSFLGLAAGVLLSLLLSP